MIVKLRTLTLKSILGFGWDKDKTVYDLILLYKELDLLKLYYFFGNIDFNQEIKDILFITKEREIDKPGSLRDKPQIHSGLGLDAHKVISLCLADYNKKNTGEFYKQMRGSFIRCQKTNQRKYTNQQYRDKEFNKDAMKWINQHGGINR